MPEPEQHHATVPRPEPLSREVFSSRPSSPSELPAVNRPEPAAIFPSPLNQHHTDAQQRRVPRDLQLWPDTEGYPPLAGGSGKEAGKEPGEPGYYFARFLQKAHPEYDEETIRKKVEQVLSDEDAKAFIEPLEKFHEELERHPDWIEAIRKTNPNFPLLPD